MITVFLDSNVLISALIGSAHSAPVVLVNWLAGSPAAELITGRCCIQEVEKNLARKLPQAQPLWLQFVSASGIRIVPCPRKSITGINAKDAAIVAAAVSASATHFVTGDKRLLAQMRAAKSKLPPALTPREMLEVLLTQA
ncbi:MAG: PIN domain-containing protein [Betaproteobacteria bacterium]|nr:PIN domain-containing protein [Betaproteobacteria bacterium]